MELTTGSRRADLDLSADDNNIDMRVENTPGVEQDQIREPGVRAALRTAPLDPQQAGRVEQLLEQMGAAPEYEARRGAMAALAQLGPSVVRRLQEVLRGEPSSDEDRIAARERRARVASLLLNSDVEVQGQGSALEVLNALASQAGCRVVTTQIQDSQLSAEQSLRLTDMTVLEAMREVCRIVGFQPPRTSLHNQTIYINQDSKRSQKAPGRVLPNPNGPAQRGEHRALPLQEKKPEGPPVERSEKLTPEEINSIRNLLRTAGRIE